MTILNKKIIMKIKEINRNTFEYECGDGWFDLIDSCLKEMQEVDNTIGICQIKSKFGELRIYYDNHKDDIEQIINKYEEIASKTCEICGSNKNTKMNTEGWYIVLCENCRREIK